MTTRATSVLVVANETLVGDELVDALRARAEQGPIRVAVVAPVTQPREGYVVYRDSRRAAAGRRLDRVLAALRLAGIPAHGGVFDDEPLAAVKDVLASEDIDEIVVSTHPETKSGWLRKNLVDEIRKAAGDRPVEHVVSDVSGARGRERPRRRERDGARRAAARPDPRSARHEGPASFLIVCPQSDPSRGEHPEAERRLRAALSILRSGGARRPRPDRAPRPVHRRDGGRRGRADGRDHRLDVPGRALRLAPARPRRPAALAERAARPARRRRGARGGAAYDAPRRGAARPRRAPRPAAREPELARRRARARDAPLHRVGDRCSSARSSPRTSSSAS